LGASRSPGSGARLLERFNLDNGPAVLGDSFSVIEVDRTRGTFRFPHADPVIRWVQSLRPGLGDGIAEPAWERVVGELGNDIARHIEDHGTFDVAKDSGVVVARW